MGRARPALVAALAMLALAAPAAAREVVDAGVAVVRVDADESPGCTVGLDAELCAARHTDNATLAPGDDRLEVRKGVDKVVLTLRPPGGPGTGLTLDPSDLRVRHPAYRALNHTWVQANGSLPAGVREYITLESRPLRDHPEKWGVFVVVHPPEPAGDPYSAGHCWQTCQFQDQDYLRMDEDSVQPFPKDGVLQLNPYGRDTDGILAWNAAWATSCWSPQYPAAACAALAQGGEAMEPGLQLYREATPALALGVEAHRFDAGLDPPPQLGSDPSPPAAVALAGPPPSGEAGAALPLGSAPLLSPSLDAPLQPLALADIAPAPSGGESAPRPEGLTPSSLGAAPSSLLLAAAAGLALLLVAVLYHRITRPQALEQETRQRVYQAIAREPGVRVGTIAARLGVAYNTAKHHVLMLEALGLVTRAGAAQQRYFASGALSHPEMRARAEGLTSPSAQAVVRFLEEHGPTDLSTLGHALALAPATVSTTASRLRRAGLVAARRTGRRVVVELARGPAQPERAPVPLLGVPAG